MRVALLRLAAPRVCDQQRAIVLQQGILHLHLARLVHVCAYTSTNASYSYNYAFMDLWRVQPYTHKCTLWSTHMQGWHS